MIETEQKLEKIVSLIQKRISHYDELATELIKEYREAYEPIPRVVHQQYDNIGNVTEGLYEALNIIMREGRD